MEVHRRYFAATRNMSAYYPYMLHNMQFILYARAMQGRIAETNKATAQLLDAAAFMAKIMPETDGFFDVFATMALMRTCQWDDLLSTPQPKSSNPALRAFWRLGRSMAYAGTGRTDDARSEQREFDKNRAMVDRNMPWDTNKMGDVMDLAAANLEARLTGSIEQWRHAVEIQDRLAYDEPPAWYYPIRESLGAALLLSGNGPKPRPFSAKDCAGVLIMAECCSVCFKASRLSRKMMLPDGSNANFKQHGRTLTSHFHWRGYDTRCFNFSRNFTRAFAIRSHGLADRMVNPL